MNSLPAAVGSSPDRSSESTLAPHPTPRQSSRLNPPGFSASRLLARTLSSAS